MPPRGRILWVDDDGPGRFRYAEGILKREGWEVDWAADAVSAAQRLGNQRYDMVILDQEAPIDGVDRSRWAGCLVLYWLRGTGGTPPGMPRADGDRQRRLISVPEPLPANRKAPVLVISDYDAKELIEAMKGASHQDRDLPVLSKPLDMGRLKGLLSQVRE